MTAPHPGLLDLFCGAGGCARGYQMAGFHVTGIDNRPQPRYAGDAFIQADALEYVAAHGHEYDCIHASPPCQAYSVSANMPWVGEYPQLIEPLRQLLISIGKPCVSAQVI
jgi:site-specific DNA-cytosine methylase